MRSLALALLLAGCFHLGPPPSTNRFRAAASPTPACAALADKVLRLTLAGGVLGSLGVSASGASPSIDNTAAKWSVAVGGAASSAAATGLGLAASYYAAQHERQGCAQ